VWLIISMGKSLHMRIVAEGVETEEQLSPYAN
jgi:sensor c-di-GMP phosphodiesterase-like protein